MTVLLLSLLAVILLGLAAEKRRAVRDRKKLTHIVHVNGIRGKSTVTRLIAAGLQAGGWNVFCKTTGTVPMTIAPDGTERPIRRPGRSNIKEQLSILHQAAQSGADAGAAGPMVYVTPSGSRYHNEGCQYIGKRAVQMPLADAKEAGYTACAKCE